MHIAINPGDDLPIYRQLMRQITDAIAGGQLTSGERLPSHRELSEHLVIAPLTVKKAYDELEMLGYIESQRGRGTFVCDRVPRMSRAARSAQLLDVARSFLAQAYLGGFVYEDVLKMLADANRDLTNEPARARRKEG
jgi:GntR family transcriptional regulator